VACEDGWLEGSHPAVKVVYALARWTPIRVRCIERPIPAAVWRRDREGRAESSDRRLVPVDNRTYLKKAESGHGKSRTW
jgi:hypothetical protein